MTINSNFSSQNTLYNIIDIQICKVYLAKCVYVVNSRKFASAKNSLLDYTVCCNGVVFTLPVCMCVVIVDINECAEYNGGCEHNCTNTNGSYSCICRAGYKLTEDEHNCTEYSLCDKLPCPLITKVIAVLLVCILTGIH